MASCRAHTANSRGYRWRNWDYRRYVQATPQDSEENISSWSYCWPVFLFDYLLSYWNSISLSVLHVLCISSTNRKWSPGRDSNSRSPDLLIKKQQSFDLQVRRFLGCNRKYDYNLLNRLATEARASVSLNIL
jgi:hypothetical protein